MRSSIMNLVHNAVGEYIRKQEQIKKEQRKREIFETVWEPNWEPFFKGRELV